MKNLTPSRPPLVHFRKRHIRSINALGVGFMENLLQILNHGTLVPKGDRVNPYMDVYARGSSTPITPINYFSGVSKRLLVIIQNSNDWSDYSNIFLGIGVLEKIKRLISKMSSEKKYILGFVPSITASQTRTREELLADEINKILDKIELLRENVEDWLQKN